MDLLEIGLRGLSDSMQVIDRLIKQPAKKRRQKSHCHCTCMDPMMDCYPCGPHRSDTDLRLEARLGERRLLSILFENNRKVSSQVTMNLAVLMDACGNVLEGNELIALQPRTFTLQPGECRRVRLGVNLVPPFEEGQVYYAEIRVDGDCCAEAISLGIWVQPDHYADHHSLCDPCRPRIGRFVEFHNCDCGCCSEGKAYYICRRTAARSGFSSKG